MSRLSPTLMMTQAAIAAVAPIGLALWPPASGRLLLVPLAGADVNAVARTALAGGAALLGPGPFPGSLVVEGDRASVVRRIGSAAVLVTAAPPGGCGADTVRADVP